MEAIVIKSTIQVKYHEKKSLKYYKLLNQVVSLKLIYDKAYIPTIIESQIMSKYLSRKVR